MKKITSNSNFKTFTSGRMTVVVILMMVMNMLSTSVVAQTPNGSYILGKTSCATCSSPGSNPTGPYVMPDTYNGSPFTARWKNSKVQYLYKANELSSTPNLLSNGADRTIKSLAFDVTSMPAGGYTIENYTVKIANYNDEDHFRDNYDIDSNNEVNFNYPGAITVNVGNVTINSLGWFTIDLGTGFVWDGESDIIVEICKSNTTASPTAKSFAVKATKYPSTNDQFTRGYYTKSNTHAFNIAGCNMNEASYSLGTAHNLAALSLTERQIRPDIKFTLTCNSSPSIAGGTPEVKGVDVSAGGCPMVTIGVKDGSEASGLDFKWLSSTNPSFTGATYIPGVNTATLQVPQSTVTKYYKRSTGCGGTWYHSSVIQVDPPATNVYNGTTWSAGAPTASNAASLRIDGGNVVLHEDVKACGCTITAGDVTVASGKTMYVDGALKVLAGATLTFENNAALVQKDGAAVNEGSIRYKRNSQPLLKFDFTYWSSPVQNQTLVGFSPETLSDKFYKWEYSSNASTPTTQIGWVVEPNTNVMTPGRGYIIRAPQTFATAGAGTVFNGTFTGKPNNGDIVVPVRRGTGMYNLLGNPYPSAIDAAAFYTENSWNLDGTFYFWTHHSPVASQNYSATDYAVYNMTGPTTASPSIQQPDGFIAAGQSFMVKGKSGSIGTATATFKNTMRKPSVNNTTFFRGAAGTSQVADAAAKHRVWLNLTNAQGFKQILVGYLDGASAEFDEAYDGDVMPGAVLSFYSTAAGHNLAIQGKGLPFSQADVLPLGFSTTLNGTHQIALGNFDGLFTSQAVYLEDTTLGVIHNLKNGAYSFTSLAGSFPNRFKLRYTDAALVGGSKASETKLGAAVEQVIVYKQNANLIINGGNLMVDAVNVYDLSGRLLLSQSGYNSSEVVLDNPNWSSQVLIVQMTATDKSIVTKKVVF
jgi:hypothetical protein